MEGWKVDPFLFRIPRVGVRSGSFILFYSITGWVPEEWREGQCMGSFPINNKLESAVGFGGQGRVDT